MKISSLSHYLIGPVTLWTSQKEIPKTYIEVKDGKVVKISDSSLLSLELPVVDGKEQVLMPAGVDAQVHLRVPGQEHKETAETGLLAALKGGYAAVLTMPNTKPTIDSVEALQLGRGLTAPYEERFGVKVLWTGAITKNLNSSTLTPIEDLARAGITALTNDGLGVLSDDVMEEAFERLSPLGIPLLQHAEFLGHGGNLAPSSVQRKVGATPYPESAELEMVERDLRALKNHPQARYHVLHITSRKVIPLLRPAKEAGLKVTCEVTPHHLFFCGEDIDPENKSFKMNPPLRTAEDREAFWKFLESGDIDFVSTDHAPHEELVKQGSFNEAAFGTIGMETTLGVLTWGYQQGRLSRQRFVEVFSTKPSRFLGLDPSYGDIQEGKTLRALLFDVNAPEREIRAEDFSSLSKNSCFIGAKLPGQLLQVFSGERCFSL